MAKFDVTTERQRTLVGLFPNLPEPLKAWEVVKRVCGVVSQADYVPTIITIQSV